nr:NAD-dependent epimerase/dehydratase family protein [Vibrio metoecus]
MNIVITGGAGFLGAMLTQTLLKNYSDTIESLTVVDRVAPSNSVTQDLRVKVIVADITDPQQVATFIAPDHHPSCSIWQRSSPAMPNKISTLEST